MRSSKGELLGSGYFNRNASLAGRMLSFGEESGLSSLKRHLAEAVALRVQLFDATQTNAFRLVNGEGDGIPGLIVDQYNDVLVLQSGTLGIDTLKSIIIEELKKLVNPRAIYERSLLGSRKEEGLAEASGILFGEVPQSLTIKENNLQYEVSVVEGQKTGFFLDQREMRSLVRGHSRGLKVLNCFSYSGAFSVSALAGGASQVVSVDVSKTALAEGDRNVELNGLSKGTHRSICEDVFKFLREGNELYDLIILDPPAFAKKKAQVVQAAKGYNDINRVAMNRLRPGGILVTCSCSHFIEKDLFRKILFSAARDAHKDARIIQEHRLAFDHPISVYHPEGEYLKSAVLVVS